MAVSSDEVRSAPSGRTADPLAPLAKRAATGSRGAQRDLLRELGPVVLRVVRGLLGARHPDVEDVGQDSLLRVVRALPTFRSESSVRYFASRVAHRAAVDYLRKNRSLERGDDAGRIDPERSARPHGSERLDHRTVIESLLEHLSEVQSETLVLRAVAGYSVDEIAEEMNVSRNTVKSRLRLAKQALRERAQELGVEGD